MKVRTYRKFHRWLGIVVGVQLLFWMLHIMDYDERNNFNTPILKVVSGFGVITVLSGFFLAGMTSPRLRRFFGGRRSD